MALLRNVTTGEEITLEPEKPFILGRGGKFKINNRFVSKQQVKITLLEDGRCFVERLAANPSLLRGQLLPMKKEVEVSDGDMINLVPDMYPFEIVIPQSHDASVTKGSETFYDDSNTQEYQTQLTTQEDAFDEDAEETTDEENRSLSDVDPQMLDDRISEQFDHEDWISTESSLVGSSDNWEETYSDLDE
ncbi:hypothetical protein VTP01DRAFT_1917 [Rhizomucor pusillus]|uniref:uncharacterized protein n=1 Tax=Rhizomucor pusillus TaxID=4840 RepID=UPI003742F06F